MIKIARLRLLLCCMTLMAFGAHAASPMAAAGPDLSFGMSADGKVDMWASNPVGTLRSAAILTVNTINVSDAPGLRAALLTAATNGQDDVIVLAAGTYATGGTTFNFVTNETNTLLLRGAEGATRDQVVLDGGGTSQVLNFSCVGSCGAITLQGVTVRNGNAGASGLGGAVYSFLGIETVTVTNSTFSNNTASDRGGAIFSLYVTVTNSIFSNNSAGQSGGAISGGGTVTVTNSTFSNNTASDRGGAIYDFAGTVTVTNSTFSNNTTTYGDGGAIFGTFVPVTNSTFSSNRATTGNGGAIWSDAGSVTNSTFSNNTAGSDGGAIYGANLVVIVTNSIFSNNTSNRNGGAIRGALAVVNNTFSGNSALSGAAISFLDSSGSIINSVFYGHTTPAIYATSAYNLYNNLINTGTGIAGSTPIMVGNVTPGATSPFVNTASGNFRLAAGSLAIDAGLDPNSTTFANLVGSGNVADIRKKLLTDLDGNIRPAPGTAVDIGTYEFGSVSPETCLFSWAESQYPHLFPGTAVTQFFAPYNYRYYAATDTYLGNNTADLHIWGIFPTLGLGLTDLGPSTTWFAQTQAAGCQ